MGVTLSFLRSNRLWYDSTFRSPRWAALGQKYRDTGGRNQEQRMTRVGDDASEVPHTQMILEATFGQAKLVGSVAYYHLAATLSM